MRILHCCLANFYIDNYAYQENLLPRMHKLQGHLVEIVASTQTYLDNKKIGNTSKGDYLSEDNIPIHRIAYASWMPQRIMEKLRYYKGFYKELDRFKPDIIFLHGTQFMDIKNVVKYAKLNPNVTIYADGHADYINSARNFFSRWILHGILYKIAAQKINPFTKKFYGTLPARVDFIHQMYKIPKEKISFLPMGSDINMISLVKKNGSRQRIRNKYNIKTEDLLIITGGKINKSKKEVLNLIDAVIELNGQVKLMIFGSVSDDLSDIFNKKISNKHIIMAGWANEVESYEYINASDIAVYPSLHSTLWEQTVGIGLPCVFNKIEGFTHIDMGGNCILTDDCSIECLKESILKCKKNYVIMQKKSEEVAQYFSYYEIAKRAIES